MIIANFTSTWRGLVVVEFQSLLDTNEAGVVHGDFSIIIIGSIKYTPPSE